MTIIKMYISNVKLPLYPSCEVKCGLQNRISTRQKRSHSWREFAFAIRGTAFSSNDQSTVAELWYPPYEKGGSHFEIGTC